MSLFKGLRRATTLQALFEKDIEWSGGNTLSGQRVDRDTAMGLAAYYACIRLLTNTVATLPLDAYRRVDGNRVPIRPKPVWIDRPVYNDRSVTRASLMTQAMMSRLTNGNTFILALPSVTNAQALYVLDPNGVEIEGGIMDEPIYKVRGADGTVESFSSEQVKHIPYLTLPGQRRGIDPIKAFATMIGQGLAVQEFGSRFFADGASLSGVIETPGNLLPDQAERLKSDFKRKNMGRRNSHAVGILEGGAKFTQLTVAPEAAQFIQTARWSAEQVCMAMGVPPHMIGLSEGTSSYASVEQKSTEFVVYSVRSHLEVFEAAFGDFVVNTDGFVKFTIDGLLRGDQKSRYEAYSTGINGGFLLYDDIRRWEDLPPLASGGTQRVPLNLAAPDIADLRTRVDAAYKLVYAGYDPDDAAAAVGLKNLKHTGLPPASLQPTTGDIKPEYPDEESPDDESTDDESTEDA